VLSARLTYRPVAPADLDAFHGLVEDEHIRRYMMDGQSFPREWSAAHIRASQALFERLGVGLWLAHDEQTDELVGFCGFLVLPEVHDGPELVYAEARAHPAFGEIVASVDAVNAASVRILEKLGFDRVGTQPGAFGDMLLLRLR
jgi:RimJ/RimL family protein N-acetyltransferase